MKSEEWVKAKLPDAQYKEAFIGNKFAISSPEFKRLTGHTLTGWQYKDGRKVSSIWAYAKRRVEAYRAFLHVKW